MFLALSFGSGCEKQNTQEDFMPPQARGQAALEKALTAWKEGKAPDEIEAGDHGIKPYDAKWRAGQKLEDFKILAAEPAEGGRTWFTVDLKMKSPKAELRTKYIVLGIDPLQVFREEDYTKLSGM